MNKATFPSGYDALSYTKAIKERPQHIITSNSKLKKDGIWNVSFPAFSALVVQGGKLGSFVTCEQAGACATYCYAQQGSYLFRAVRIKHARNLQFLLDDPFTFADQVVAEIARVSQGKGFRAIRWNDSGDMHPALWAVAKVVMERLPNVKFYAYTKYVSAMKARKAKGEIPANFTYVLSYGGREDAKIDTVKDRHAMAFGTMEELTKYKYTDAHDSDIPATMPNVIRVGLIAHGNHKALEKIKGRINVVVDKNRAKLTA